MPTLVAFDDIEQPFGSGLVIQALYDLVLSGVDFSFFHLVLLSVLQLG